MKIVVITGSPRKNSTSNYLADEFIKGASENGHEIYKFDSNKANMKHCIACDSCGRGLKPCIFKDDFIELKEHILKSDLIVFVTPVYYFDMASNLKKVIDRLYSINNTVTSMKKKSILITSQHSELESVKDSLNSIYLSISNWMNMTNLGIINALGIDNIEQMKQTPYPKQAYELGKNI